MTFPIFKKFLALGLFAIVLSACNSSKSVTVSKYFTEYDNVPENTAIFFSRGACFGQCPEDKVIISLKGELTYIGKRSVQDSGTFKATNFGKEEYEQLQNELIALDVFSFTDDYTGNIADFPPYTIFMQKDGKAIKIEAKSEYPEGIKTIINRFVKLIGGLKLQEVKS